MSQIVSACGHANDAGLRFCTTCGVSLLACPSCGQPFAAGQRFCGHCGAALEPAAAPPESVPDSERKQATVLFADAVNSMALAERLGPDQLSEVMQGLFAIGREAVESFGGTVDKFTGDGIMALFGAPVAQEDHARRACHAALRLIARAEEYALMLRQRDVEVAVRVGLNSGEVIAGAVGETFTAVGHTVGLAQRMEALADPGTIRLTEHTAALVGDEFELHDLGPTTIKGVSAPVGMLALATARGGPASTGRQRGVSARLVGRDEELASLLSALGDAMQGRTRLFGIVGEPGAGKSRLSDELAARASQLGVTVRRIAGVSHARDVPLLPILGFLREYFAITDTDSAAQVRAKVGARLLTVDPAFESELGIIFDFLDVPDPNRPAPALGPEVRRKRVLEVLRRVTVRRSETQPLLLILEDLHWFDEHSAAFLQAWLPTFLGTRTMVVTNFRPEFRADWMASSHYRQLPLPPLDESAADELLAELLGPDPSVALLTATVRDSCGGNPFFAEELVRSLALDGTLVGTAGAYRVARADPRVQMPPTVQAVLTGRIDRLGRREKNVLQAASVIGRTFTVTVLRAVVENDPAELSQALSTLCIAEMIQTTEAEDTFRFWHALTHEAAYGTLVAATRRRLHSGVARALLATDPERHDELAGLLASHFEAAGDHLEAARWQIRAAGRATTSDYAEAARRARSALAQLEQLPADEESSAVGMRARILLLRLLVRTGLHGEEVTRVLAEARAAVQHSNDPASRAGLAFAVASVRMAFGEVSAGRSSYLESVAHAGEAGDPGVLAHAQAGVIVATQWTGDTADGLRRVEQVLDLCGDDPLLGAQYSGFSLHDWVHASRVALLLLHGRLDEAREAGRIARENFARRPMSEWHGWTLSSLAPLADWTAEAADLAQAQELLPRAVQLATDSGSLPAIARSGLGSGVLALLCGEPGRALEHVTDTLTQLRDRRSALFEEGNLLVCGARAHHALGDIAAARATADEAVAVAVQQGADVVECLAHTYRARIYRESARDHRDLDEARAAVTAGEKLAVITAAGTYAACLAEERARLDGGDLGAVAAGYDRIGATGHAARLRAENVTTSR